MLTYRIYEENLLYFDVTPKGPVPTLFDPDGIYPYESYVETAKCPRIRSFRMICLENDLIRGVVCPDLGGKVFSLYMKSEEKEVLFDSGAVKPVRILPRMAFISGGIEVSFPISHTPSQLEPVCFQVKEREGRIYVWMGETEAAYGMQWTLEFSMGEGDGFLTQRVLLHNPTAKTCSYMSWSNGAVPARADSIISYPAGEVLDHSRQLAAARWEGDVPNCRFDRMHGFFWKSKDCNAFGVYTPSLGTGLYHIADEKEAPGMKLWLYGIGEEERWAYQTALKKESYIEIQAGPLREQAEKLELAPGERRMRTEFWIPADRKLKIREIALPCVELIGEEEIPLFGLADKEKNNIWRRVCQAYEKGDRFEVQEIGPTDWPSCAIPGLGEALDCFAREEGDPMWKYYYALFLLGAGFRIMEDDWKEAGGEEAAGGEPAGEEAARKLAMELLQASDTDAANGLLGRIFRIQGEYEASRQAYDRIRHRSWREHPQIVAERDMTLEKCPGTLELRKEYLDAVEGVQDDYLVERRVKLLMDSGEYGQAKTLLLSHEFEPVHQRYERTGMLYEILEKLGEPKPDSIPQNIGEDQLAVYGAYRVNET